MTLTTLGYAFIGGLLPALIWLFFLLREDARCPEPRHLIALAFLGGMLAVPLVLPIEQAVRSQFAITFRTLVLWACIEETIKYVTAALLVLWRREVNEPSDYVIYLITVALGFAAAENMLFLLGPFGRGEFAIGFATGDVRFLGSTLLHVIASSAVGFAFAYAALHPRARRVLVVTAGLFLAVALHTGFNALIINQGGETALLAFFFVWLLALVFFAVLEVLKYFEYRNLPANICPP